MTPKSLRECYIERLDQLQLCFDGNCLKFCQIWCLTSVGIKSESGRNQTTQNDEFWTQNDKLRCTSHIHCTKTIVWVPNWASRPTTIALWLKLFEILSNLMFLPVSESSRNQVGIRRNQSESKCQQNMLQLSKTKKTSKLIQGMAKVCYLKLHYASTRNLQISGQPVGTNSSSPFKLLVTHRYRLHAVSQNTLFRKSTSSDLPEPRKSGVTYAVYLSMSLEPYLYKIPFRKGPHSERGFPL